MTAPDIYVPAPGNWSIPQLEQLVAKLVAYMAAHHTGAANGVRGDFLAAVMELAPRVLRRVISAAREQGTAIVGTPETGYYIAATAAELEQCCAFLRSRALHSLHLEARLRQIPLPELLGQLHLPT